MIDKAILKKALLVFYLLGIITGIAFLSIIIAFFAKVTWLMITTPMQL